MFKELKDLKLYNLELSYGWDICEIVQRLYLCCWQWYRKSYSYNRWNC